MSSPAQGRVGGTPVRARRLHQVRSQVVVTHHETTPVGERPTHPETTSGCLQPAPSSTHPAQIAALTGVQRLLASVGTSHQEG
ncbi:hypothetical protein [Actinopolymorpha pittospori]|uniref:Uncharacterized protein n=1 Tax=Actinopolymorpha pittospori TaxID=648752 RepID=A0A927MZQ6_9ACTN|nr:hypothetical protein [Actinopolymorpha pittospori]MBE1609951.1 hypothetical protein [Actinopolymorpha pittospori]